MKTYVIRNTPDIDSAQFDRVDCWPWGFDYEPKTLFRAVHTDECIKVSLRCYEKDPYAGVTKTGGYVCNDSCMEFFITPSADNSLGYFNFEMNSNPTYLLEYGYSHEKKHQLVEWDESEYALRTTYGEDEGEAYWQVDFEIPYGMIKKYAPEASLESGSVMRGNVYKCGRHQQPEHYGTWNLVETETPNFHKSEYFGKFILE